MNERNYWAFRVYSTPDAVLRKLTSLVTVNGLRDKIPSYCLEKLVHEKGQHEFLLFLSIVADDQNYIPQEIKEGLSYANISKLAVDYPLKYDEIKPMTRPEAEIEVGSYARQIEYHPPRTDLPENPFDFAIPSEPDSLSSEAYNRLLYWMSAVGKGTWQSFREACRSLGLGVFEEARHIFRRLRLLGHIEYLNGGTHWIACPSCLVKVGGHYDARYYLSGTQVPSLIGKIQGTAKFEIKGNYGGPESNFITFKADSDAQALVDLLKKDYTYFRYAGVASLRLAAILPNLEGWYSKVLSTIGVVSEQYSLDKWNGKGFGTPIAYPTEPGMYMFTSHESSESNLRYYFYYDPERNCWLQGDWYGLRFLANHHLGFQAEFKYEPNLRQLYIPNLHHVPDLYERALVLASGKLPSPVSGGLVYENIDELLAETICSKLYVRIIKGV